MLQLVAWGAWRLGIEGLGGGGGGLALRASGFENLENNNLGLRSLQLGGRG